MLTSEDMKTVEEILERSVKRTNKMYYRWGLDNVNMNTLCRVLEQLRKINEER